MGAEPTVIGYHSIVGYRKCRKPECGVIVAFWWQICPIRFKNTHLTKEIRCSFGVYRTGSMLAIILIEVVDDRVTGIEGLEQ
jgi:hypothetical protein